MRSSIGLLPHSISTISLAWPGHPVREGCPYPGQGAGLDPHAECEGVHLRQALGDAAVQVVGPLGEGHLKLLGGLEISSPWN